MLFWRKERAADLVVRVAAVQSLGHATLLEVSPPSGLSVLVPAGTRPAVGDPIGLRLPRPSCHFFDAHTEERLS